MTFSSRLKLLFVAALIPFALGCEEVERVAEEDSATFYVDSISSSFTEVTEFNALQMPKQLTMTLKACLNDRIVRRRLYDRPFTVVSGSSTKDVTSNDQGCIYWDEKFDFDYFAPEKNIEITRRIVAGEGTRGAKTVKFAVNPWSKSVIDLERTRATTNIAENGGDQGDFKATLKPSTIAETDKAYVDLKSISLGQRRLSLEDFKIDENLTLQTPLTFEVVFNPTLYRKHINSEFKGEAATSGQVRFSFAILRESAEDRPLDDPRNYIASYEKVLPISEDTVKEDITLYITNLAEVTTRTRVLVKVEPIVESNSLRPGYFEGFLGPLSGSTSINLRPTNLNVAAAFNKFAAAAQRAKTEAVEPLARFQQNSGFSEMKTTDRVMTAQNMRSFEQEVVPMNLARKVLEGDYKLPAVGEDLIYQPYARGSAGNEWVDMQRLYTSLCKQLYPAPTETLGMWERNKRRNPFDEKVKPSNAYHYCMNNPTAFVAMQKRHIVREAKGNIKVMGTLQEETLSVNLTVRKAFSESSSWNRSLGFNSGASFNPLAIGGLGKINEWITGVKFNVGVSGSFGYVKSWSNTNSTSASITASRTTSIFHSWRTFEITVEANTCLLASPVVPGVTADDGSNGRYLCPEDMVEDVTTTETYHLMTQSSGNSANPFLDTSDPREQPWRMMIRGDHTFQQFAQLIGAVGNNPLNNEVKEIVIERWDQNTDRNSVLEMFTQITQDYPGMLSPTNQ